MKFLMLQKLKQKILKYKVLQKLRWFMFTTVAKIIRENSSTLS